MLAPRRLLCCSALLAASAGLVACGSGESDTAATAASHVRSDARGPGSAARTQSSKRACAPAHAPRPRPSERLGPPSGRLNPADRYVVTLATNCGKIQIALDVRTAPRTTSSFAYLVKRGFYDDLTFHRVAAGYVIQGGDPNGDGTGGPGYTVVEPPPKSLRYTLGTVAMAKTEADPSGASGSQFFIVTARSTALPPQYALVGRVVGDMSAVLAIGGLATDPPQDGAPTLPVVIDRATLSVRS